jgi:alpha-galactosidase
MKLSTLAIASLFLCASSLAARAETIAVSQLDLTKATIGWGQIGRGRSVEKNALSLGQRKFDDGIGTHAPGVIRVRLDGKAQKFSAFVGVDNEVGNGKGSVVFRVIGDGQELFRSPLMKSGDAPQRIEVLLSGVQSLIFVASDGGDGNAFDHADWGDAQIEYSGATPTTLSVVSERIRLTPPASPLPRINGAKVFGVRSGAPLLFKIAASGEKPLKYQAKLPQGVQLDAASGVLSGKLEKAGEYRVPITVSNARGKTSGELVIKVGAEILLTPPMGWNSWYQMSEAVSQAGVLGIARAMQEKGLADYGWTFVNVDDCWQGERGGPNLALQPNERFPDMKALTDDIHALGLKAGIYSTPWMGSYNGFAGGSAPNAEGTYPAGVPREKRLQPHQLFGRFPGVRNTKMDRIGPFWFFDRDAKQVADWGFDYIKMDWDPNDVPTTQRMAEDLRALKRDVALSLSNTAPFEHAKEFSSLSQAWRNTGDIIDTWSSISEIARDQEKWQSFTRPGHWNDPDMLMIGNLGTPNQYNTTYRPTRLSPDEQYFQVSLWSLVSAPLLLSCDIASMDDFTLGLVTNAEVIAVNQDAAGQPARRIPLGENQFAWVKPLADGTVAVGLFNTDEFESQVTLPLAELGFSQSVRIRDLWRQKELGTARGEYSALVNSHGVALLKISL